jgi:shikimate dehydrogenase
VPPGRLVAAFDELRGAVRGLNVTAPLKEAVIPLLDVVSPEAAAAGSVNTVTFADDGRATGSSTDGAGFLAALGRAGAPPEPGQAGVVLGTGGAARAVIVALRSRGVHVTVWGRNADGGARLEMLGARFEQDAGGLTQALHHADLLVNATPVGGWPRTEACPLPTAVSLPPSLVVMDLVYRPRRTTLLLLAEGAGCRVVPGIEMLIEQGARSFELWTGLPAPVKVMRTVAYQALRTPIDHPALSVIGAGEAG